MFPRMRVTGRGSHEHGPGVFAGMLAPGTLYYMEEGDLTDCYHLAWESPSLFMVSYAPLKAGA